MATTMAFRLGCGVFCTDSQHRVSGGTTEAVAALVVPG